MQRIAIARALVRDPSILLLDEATSALDAESEKAVTAALQEVMETRTTMFIAHRLTTLKNCTQIVELGDGGIKRAGTYQEIVSQTA
jgi:ATP-binding cassette subfamily B protein